MDIDLKRLRTIGQQRHSSNAPATTTLEYSEINMYNTLLDHLLTQLNDRLIVYVLSQQWSCLVLALDLSYQFFLCRYAISLDGSAAVGTLLSPSSFSGAKVR